MKMFIAKYYQDSRDRLQKKTRERYQSIFKEQKKATVWA